MNEAASRSSARRPTWPRRSRPRFIPGFGRHPLEGFLFPATYDFTAKTTSAQLASRQLTAFQRNWSKLNLAYARSKNLTPYDVLIIASMIEAETAAPEERQLVSAVIYNRLHNRMQLGIDATLRYGLHIPPTESIHQSQLETPGPYNTSALGGHFGLTPTPIGNPGLASLQAAAHPAHVDYLYYVRKPDKRHHFFTASLDGVQRLQGRARIRMSRLVGLLGQPVAESLSPRMQNAAFAARALDWAYVPLEIAPEGLERAVAGLVSLGFAGANVTIPHKQAVVAFCDEADGDSVNTLVIREGRVLGFNTDREIVAGIEAERVCLIGAGGAAAALLPALPGDVRVFSRSGEWPPDASGCDLVVNATPVRDELLVEPRPEQAVVDLAYNADGSPTALVAAAREAGCREVVDGLEALVRQGAASFTLWTGVEAPVEVMRAALGVP